MLIMQKGSRVILGIGWTLISCGQSHRSHSYSTSEPQYHFQPKLADSAISYYYDVSSSVKSRSEIKDKKIESTGISNLGLIFHLAKDITGGMSVNITYDKLHVIMDNEGEHKDITAHKGDTVADPVERMLGNILGSELNVSLDKAGNIQKVSGSKELKGKILSAMSGADPAVRTAVETQLDRLAGEAFVKSTLQQIFKLVPDSVHYAGDTWTHNQETDGVKLSITTLYTLKDVDGKTADISGSSEIKDDDGTPVLFMGQSFPATFNGEQKSQFQVDLASGLVTKGQVKMDLRGTIVVLGTEVPIKIESEKKLDGRRIPIDKK